MTTVFTNPDITDDERRARIYSGQVLVHSASPESLALIEHARNLITELFGGRDPQTAQFDMAVEDYVKLLAELKPRFIHHPESKERVKPMIASFGCDPDETYFDLPRMRTSTSDAYLTSGIAYAFHPHRDTWYSAPFSQLNWWIPIYPVQPENVMAFHPQHWSNPVRNGSRRYNYYEWPRESGHGGTTRQERYPRAAETRGTRAAGSAGASSARTGRGDDLLRQPAAFDGAHTSGKTRFSIDFRTVNIGDVRSRREAPNVDSECIGTSLRDFLRVRDLDRMPEDVALDYEGIVRMVTTDV